MLFAISLSNTLRYLMVLQIQTVEDQVVLDIVSCLTSYCKVGDSLLEFEVQNSKFVVYHLNFESSFDQIWSILVFS